MLDAERFLTETEPFSHLPGDEIRTIVDSLAVSYHKKGEIILREDQNDVNNLYIIRSGVIAIEKSGEIIEYLYEGDTFGYVSILSGEVSPYTARAVEDTVLFLLPAKEFLKFFNKYEFIREFYTKKLSKGVLIRQYCPAGSISIGHHGDITLDSLELRPLIILPGEEPVIRAVQEMIAKDSTYVLVDLPQGIGILTERDVLKKVIAKGFDPSKISLKEVATYPVISIDSSATLHEAILLMARHGIRKLLVKTEERPLGVIEERDIILYESKNVVTLTKEIDKAKSLDDLRHLFNLAREHVLELIFQGADPERLGRYISEVNDKIMKRVVTLTLEMLGEEPLCSFSILVLGSEGRREQSLKTDQDNALVFAECREEREKILSYFERFSKQYIDNLIQIGFPPCPGDVMISNPFWRRSLREWISTVENWLTNPKPENTLRIAIFFDFRTVYGDEGLGREIWTSISKIVKINIAFVRFLAHDAVNFRPPLGLFKDFVVEKSGEHVGELDLKKGGIFPLVQGVRALALEAGIRAQNTFDRIRELQSRNVLNAEYAKDLLDAYKFILGLRFKFQAQKIKENKEPDNYINPSLLSKAERSTLRDVFRFIKGFQDYLRERYNLAYL